MLDGAGPLLAPHAPGEPLGGLAAGVTADRYPAGIAVGTSGSTGRPKRAILPTSALLASAAATHEVLGGPGRWLLVLPPHHIAGLQVILRSLVAGAEPARGAPGQFTATGFVADLARAGTGCRYVSLVPTQLRRLLADPSATAALRDFDAVVVGGAALGADLLADARARGIRIVTSYGMSETAGGCVYDGLPLPGVLVSVQAGTRADYTQADDSEDGRIHLGGPTVGLGYLPDDLDTPPEPFPVVDETRWFRTDDIGRLEAGRLSVLGRDDDMIVTGGLKVAPRIVQEAVARALPGVEGVAFGVPDEEWGQVVALALAAAPEEAEAVRTRWPQILHTLRGELGGHCTPKYLLTLPAIPLLGPGKPDRGALRRLLASGG